jgi:hypothetical protein
MKKTIILLLSFAACVQLTAQKIKTAEQLGLTNKGIYVGLATSFAQRGEFLEPEQLASRSLLDAQLRFSESWSAGIGLGFEYEKSNSFIEYSTTRFFIQPEVRYWLHKETQRIMPYLYLNYRWTRENNSDPVQGSRNTHWNFAAGAGCIGWLNRSVGIQVRSDVFYLRSNQIGLTDSPLISTRIGVVFKTSKE